MPITTVWGGSILAGAISGGAAATTGIIGARSQSGAQRRATDVQSRGLDQQLAWEREQEARRQQEYDREQEELRRQFDAQQAQLIEDREYQRKLTSEITAESIRRDTLDRAERERATNEEKGRYTARETRLQPTRAAGAAAVGRLNDIASQAGVTLMPVGQGQLTRGLPGAPGATPYTPPPPPVAPTLGQLVPARM